jgi:hypothetical protein
MAEQENVKFLSLNKKEDQFIVAVFLCLMLSFIFGLQPGTTYAILWAGLGVAALFFIYFAFPNTWTYAPLLFAIYAISAFGVIIIFHWGDRLLVSGLSIAILAGVFFFASAIYMEFHIIQSIKKARDAQSKRDKYVPLGFWSISVIMFAGFSFLSIIGWAYSVNSGGSGLQLYLVLEPIIAFLLIYILWLPDRNIDWSIKDLPKSPVANFISMQTDIVKHKVIKMKNVCPECGLKLKVEKKICPSCGNSQVFGWCVRSEAHVIPCTNCGAMSLFGKEKCESCGKRLTGRVSCNSCKKEFHVKEWTAKT